MANDWPVVLCREKFTEGLPFVVRQDADVAINNQSGRLVLLPAVGQGRASTAISLPWKLIRLVVWVAALAAWARACVPPAGGATICSNAWSFSRTFSSIIPLGDLVIDVSEMHVTQVVAQLDLQVVFRGLQRSPRPLVVDQRPCGSCSARPPGPGGARR